MKNEEGANLGIFMCGTYIVSLKKEEEKRKLRVACYKNEMISKCLKRWLQFNNSILELFWSLETS